MESPAAEALPRSRPMVAALPIPPGLPVEHQHAGPWRDHIADGTLIGGPIA